MKPISFGLYLPMAGRDLTVAELLDELLEEVVFAQDAGFDLVLVPEHHDGPTAAMTSPMTLTTWILARTEHIRVGPGVLLLPLYHPVHVAEWSALLQHASGNRLILGVGTGYQREDFDRFGTERSRRVDLLEDGLSLLRDGWRGAELPGGTLVPRLEPGSEPPIWMGAWSTRGLHRAARYADAWLVDPMRTVDEISTMAASYRAAVHEGGGGPQEIVVIRELWVDENDRKARELYSPLIAPIVRYYVRRGAINGTLDQLDNLIDARVIVGSAETVTERIVDLFRKTGATTGVFTLRQPAGPSHAEVLHAIDLLGRVVLPSVRHALAERIQERHA